MVSVASLMDHIPGVVLVLVTVAILGGQIKDAFGTVGVKAESCFNLSRSGIQRAMREIVACLLSHLLKARD